MKMADDATVEAMLDNFDAQWRKLPPSAMEEEFINGIRIKALEVKLDGIQKFNKLFYRLDLNHDNILTKDELRQGMADCPGVD